MEFFALKLADSRVFIQSILKLWLLNVDTWKTEKLPAYQKINQMHLGETGVYFVCGKRIRRFANYRVAKCALVSPRDRWQVTWTRPRAFLDHQSLSFGYGMESRVPTLIVTATETFNFQSSDLCAFLPPQKRILVWERDYRLVYSGGCYIISI